jgi:hypothetical protein
MIEQIDVQDRPGPPEPSSQATVNSLGTNNRIDLDAMTDLELRCAIQQLSNEIEERKRRRPMQANLSWVEQVEWEAAIICAMYQRESIQFELLYRGIDNLGRVQVADAESQCILVN